MAVRFCILLLILPVLPGLSQHSETKQVRILIQGLVIDGETLDPLPGTQISVNDIFSSVAHDNGSFAFYVNTRDTVSFSMSGYSKTLMIVSDSLVGRQYVAGIYMHKDTIEIGEVVIVPRMASMRYEILNSESKVPKTMENAKYNVAVSAYSGRTTTGNLGDAASNYGVIRQMQRTDAYERGGIPSDRIVGLSPFMLIPAAYLLMNGLPEKPGTFKPDITDDELKQIHRKYMQQGNR